MSSILLATDGSEYARRAARRAIDLAAERDATLHVLCVVDERRFDDPALSSMELATIYADEHASLTITEVTEMAADTGIVVEGASRHGIPYEVILAYAEEVAADLIVVGEHGDHDEHFSGVGKRVADRADCEVIVVESEPS